MQRVRNYGELSPKWQCLYDTLALKVQGFMQDRIQKDCKKPEVVDDLK